MNTKAKGSSYERKIAKILSLWLSDGKYGDWVWRTASSGAKATQTNASKYYYGDLMPVHSDANWLFDYVSIECKNVAKWKLNLFKIFTGSQFNLHRFWKQAKGDADSSGRIPILIFHLPQTPFDLIMFERKRFPFYLDLGFGHIPYIELSGSLVILRLDMVLSKLDPNTLKNWFKWGRL